MFVAFIGTEHGLCYYYFKELRNLKDIGAKLKEARESIGVSVEEAAEDLKLKVSQIENLEAGNMEAFQDVFYLKYFIKDYAKYTGMNEDALANTFRPQALNHVKLDLGLRKVAELENIQVSDEKIEKEYEKIAEQYKMKPEQIKKFVMPEDVKRDIMKSEALEIIRKNKVEK